MVALYVDYNCGEVLIPDTLTRFVAGFRRKGLVIGSEKDDGWDAFNIEYGMGPHVSIWFQEGVYFQRVRMSVRGGRVAKMQSVRLIRIAEPLQPSLYRGISH